MMPDTRIADECAVVAATSGDLDRDGVAEWLAEVRVLYGTRRVTEWHVLREHANQFLTLGKLYDAEGFTPDGEQMPPHIVNQRILASGAWDCSDCGCTVGVAAIELAPGGSEIELRIDRAGTQILEEPPVCEDP